MQKSKGFTNGRYFSSITLLITCLPEQGTAFSYIGSIRMCKRAFRVCIRVFIYI